MDVILSFNNLAEVLVLPVLPEEIEISTGLNNNTFDVVSLGEIGVIGNRKMNTVFLSSFFPANYSSYCQYTNIPDPHAAVEKLERWRDSKKPIRLTITGTPLNTTMACMIEEFSYRERGGQPGDIYYDLSLKEYRFIKPRVVEQAIDAGESRLTVSSARPDEREIPETYIAMKGDCLYTIAKRFYGDGAKWKELYEKNEKTIGHDPDLINPGQELIL